jgi:asparagine synthase (glutamine-hydrolysing)
MSVLFGQWSFERKPIDLDFIDRASAMLDRYGPDGGKSYCSDGISMIYRAFHTTVESRRETQPYASASGKIVAWDGRLDNRRELMAELDLLSGDDADVSIIAAAYDKWGVKSFGRLFGDWALSVWDQNDRSLILAKDPIGTRHLYYWLHKSAVTWSSVLDPLVLLSTTPLSLCEEYLAGWFSFFPKTQLTPYQEILAVQEGTFVVLGPAKHRITKYWDFDPKKRVFYKTDGEYEEHFRAAFSQAIRRRLRSDRPVLAELSGGMDSSSIVCMADSLMANCPVATPRLDTVSFYDDSEPNWDERPFFTKVEEKRGRAGCHIDMRQPDHFLESFASDCFAASPGSGAHRSQPTNEFAACMESQGNRVVLSGIGGDEVTGGVPTPLPELQDFLAGMRLRLLSAALMRWALHQRRPWFKLLLEAVQAFIPTTILDVPKHLRPASWFTGRFAEKNGAVLRGYPDRLKLLAPRPSFQHDRATLCALSRQLACTSLPLDPLYEKRYPFLDVEFVEFMMAVPCEQLVRPGQRRSLMRRALVGIVPHELLNRRRKAFVSRGPLTEIAGAWPQLSDLCQHMLLGSFGIVDTARFLRSTQSAMLGTESHTVSIMRTLRVEFWLRNLRTWNAPIACNNEGVFHSRLISQPAATLPHSPSQVQCRLSLTKTERR